MWNLVKHISLKDVLAAIAIVLLIQKFLKEIFGINMIGQKIYKGAPLIWKWIMRTAIERREIHNKLDMIMAEVTYNSGSSLKDTVRRIETSVNGHTTLMKYLQKEVDFNSLRLDISDIGNDRMTFRFDGEGRCKFINEAFLKTFGYTERDMLGFNWESIIDDDDLEDVRDKWKRAIQTKSRYFNEQKMWNIKREQKLVRVIGYPIIEEGVLAEFYGTLDIL